MQEKDSGNIPLNVVDWFLSGLGELRPVKRSENSSVSRFKGLFEIFSQTEMEW